MRAVLAAAAGALVLAGVALAQEVQPPAAAPPPPPPSADAPPTIADSAPPEEAAPAPERAPKVVIVEPDDAADTPDVPPPPPPPLTRPRFASAVLQATDKITAETLRFEARVNQPVRYKGVVITVHACETTAADEPVFDSIAHMEVSSQPEVRPGKAAPPPRQVFRGWMFAGSPALHPFEHPVYDLWVIACKTPAPEVAAGRA